MTFTELTAADPDLPAGLWYFRVHEGEEERFPITGVFHIAPAGDKPPVMSLCGLHEAEVPGFKSIPYLLDQETICKDCQTKAKLWK